jgi:excisionase family DNA binding protein
MNNVIVLSAAELDEFKRQLGCEVLQAIRDGLATSEAERTVDRSQLAALLNVSVPTIDRMVRQGTIPSLRINNRRLFLPSEVYAALRDNQTQGESPGDSHGKLA